MEYNETDYEYDYNDYPPEGSGNSAKGLKIAIVILLVVLAAMSVVYWKKVRELRGDQAELAVEKDTLSSRIAALLGEMGEIKFDNDTLNSALMNQRHVADSLLGRLKQERNLNYAKIRQYEKEVGTLRTAMQGFVRQLDSLNRVNQQLSDENVRFRREMSTLRLRAEAAEETASELDNVVRRGSQLRARDISLLPLNKRDKVVSRAKQVEKLVAQFVVAGNDIAKPGERTVYIRIFTPDDVQLAPSDNGTFTFEGETLYYTARRNVDYQGEDLPVSIFYDVTGLFAGQYTVMIYADGQLLGQSDLILK